MSLRPTGIRTSLEVVERNLCDEYAAGVLEAIAEGKISRCLFPWIPLMQGGDEAGIIQRWIELASQESESRLRADYGGLALVFAEAAKRLPLWKEALKEWNVIESQQVLEWMAMAEANSVLEVLEAKFPPGAPPALVEAIRASTNREQLRDWLRIAAKADSLDAFRQSTGL
jgi:hypothetical protein